MDSRIDYELFDDHQNEVQRTRSKPKSKRRFIPFIPKLYWFFYRTPFNFFLLLTTMIPGSMQAIFQSIIGSVIDSFSTDEAEKVVKLASLKVICFAFGLAVVNFFNRVGWSRTNCQIEKKAKSMIFKYYMKNDVSFFDSHSFGEMMRMLNQEVGIMIMSFGPRKSFQLRALGSVISGFLTVIICDYHVLFFLIVALVFVCSLSLLFAKIGKTHFIPAREAGANRQTMASETISNPLLIQAFNRQMIETERFSTIHDKWRYHWRMRFTMFGLSRNLSQLIGDLLLPGYLCFGTYLYLRNEITVGNLLLIFRAMNMCLSGIRDMLNSAVNETDSIDTAAKIFEIIETPPKNDPDAGIELADFHGEIEFQNVWFKYPTRDTWVLKDISFRIEPGQIAAFVGSSGSGKSTIVQLLLRFYDVTEGKILLDGVDICQLNTRWLHRRIGIVQQDPVLFSLSVINNIKYSDPDASDDRVINVSRLSLLHDFIQTLPNGYDEEVGEGGGRLSGGQKQRVAISRAILTDPTILITDEATSALDAASEQFVQQSLDAVMQGRTSIIIAHRLVTIRAAKIIFVLDKGALVEFGTHEELIQVNGVYRNLVQKQLMSIPSEND